MPTHVGLDPALDGIAEAWRAPQRAHGGEVVDGVDRLLVFRDGAARLLVHGELVEPFLGTVDIDDIGDVGSEALLHLGEEEVAQDFQCLVLIPVTVGAASSSPPQLKEGAVVVELAGG